MIPALKSATLNYYETVDTRGPEDVVALFARDALYRRPGYETFVGRPSLLSFYGGQRVIERGRHVVKVLLVDGDRVAVEGEFEGFLRDGSEVNLRFADFFRFTEGLIAERASYFDVPAV